MIEEVGHLLQADPVPRFIKSGIHSFTEEGLDSLMFVYTSVGLSLHDYPEVCIFPSHRRILESRKTAIELLERQNVLKDHLLSMIYPGFFRDQKIIRIKHQRYIMMDAEKVTIPSDVEAFQSLYFSSTIKALRTKRFKMYGFFPI